MTEQWYLMIRPPSVHDVLLFTFQAFHSRFVVVYGRREIIDVVSHEDSNPACSAEKERRQRPQAVLHILVAVHAVRICLNLSS
jgi:hypothetical protein